MISTVFAILMYGMTSAVLGTLLPNLSRQLGFTDAQNGNVAFVQSVGLIVSSVSTGMLIDRKGTRLGVLIGLGVVIAALLCLARSSSFAWVAGSMLLLGLGGGTVSTSTNTVASQFSPERRASMLNLFNLFFGVGGLITPLIGAYWFPGNTLGLCYLVAALTAGTFLMHLPKPPRSVAKVAGFRYSDAGRLTRNRTLVLISLFLFFYIACEVGVWNWFAKHLVAQGMAEKTALSTLSFGFASGILLGRLAASRIPAHISALNVTLLCSLLMAITTWGMLQTRQALTAGLLVFVAGLAMAPVFPTTLGLIGDRFPGMTSTAIGIAITSGWIGLAVSSKLIGVLAGNDSAHLKTALLVIPMFSLLMIIVNFLLRASLRAPGVPAAPIPA